MIRIWSKYNFHFDLPKPWPKVIQYHTVSSCDSYARSNRFQGSISKRLLVYLILAGISFILAAAMKGEKLVGWKVVLSFSVLSVVLILFATIMKIQLNFLVAEVANLGEFFFIWNFILRTVSLILYHTI